MRPARRPRTGPAHPNRISGGASSTEAGGRPAARPRAATSASALAMTGIIAPLAIVGVVPAAPVSRPTWLKVAALAATAGVVAWPVLAMLGLLGVIPPETVLNVGIVAAVLAYVSIRRIRRDREIATGGTEAPEPPPEGEAGPAPGEAGGRSK